MTSTNQTERTGLTIVRQFKAPKTLVFNAFSDETAFAEWWNPVGMPVTVINLDFKKGGKLHYKMEGNGQQMWGVMHYQNIIQPDLIEFINSFSDEHGNVCKSPFPIDFPHEIFNRLTLEEKDGITTLTLSGRPINATPEQEAVYFSMLANMNQGFAGTFDQLEAYLAKTTAG